MGAADEVRKRHEMRVFREFAAAVPLLVHSVTSRDAPEPDIMASLETGPCYFELGRLADDGYARFMLDVFKRAPALVSPNFAEIGYPQRDVLRTKLTKSYKTFGHPVHLLLYFDVGSPLVEGPIPPMPFDEEATHVMEPLLREDMGAFTKVWYFERYRQTILWSYP